MLLGWDWFRAVASGFGFLVLCAGFGVLDFYGLL